MLGLRLDNLRSILCLGAHSDDIEIGCGGSVLQLLSERTDLEVTWVVMSGDDARRDEATRSAEAFLTGCRKSRVVVERFRDAYFPAQWSAIKNRFGQLAAEVDPDLIFTHRLEDRHQDHRIIAELTWNHFREHTVLEYEIPKFEGDLDRPNAYIPLQAEIAQGKIELLRKHFATQRSKAWFSDSTFEGLMRIRGIESGSESGWAEGFHARKVVLSTSDS